MSTTSCVMAKVLDWSLQVNEFELHCYFHFQTNTLEKGMNPLVHPALSYMISLIFFNKDIFSIK